MPPDAEEGAEAGAAEGEGGAAGRKRRGAKQDYDIDPDTEHRLQGLGQGGLKKGILTQCQQHAEHSRARDEELWRQTAERLEGQLRRLFVESPPNEELQEGGALHTAVAGASSGTGTGGSGSGGGHVGVGGGADTRLTYDEMFVGAHSASSTPHWGADEEAA